MASTEVDLVSGLLWEAGVSAIEERPLRSGDDRVVLVAGLATPAGAVQPSQVAAGLGDRWPLRAVVVDDEGWRDTWRLHARPQRAGRRFVITIAGGPRRAATGPQTDPETTMPEREEWAPAEGDVLLDVDPGRAFGSGSHPSTRLALAALEEVVRPGTAVLDVGTGSGILAVAAARLGARPVVAVDPDRRAVEAATHNVERLGLGHVVSVSDRPLAAVSGRFGVVVANILPGVLVDLAGDLWRRAAVDRPVLVLSGIPEDRAAFVLAAFPDVAVRHRVEDGWVALTLGLPPPV